MYLASRIGKQLRELILLLCGLKGIKFQEKLLISYIGYKIEEKSSRLRWNLKFSILFYSISS